MMCFKKTIKFHAQEIFKLAIPVIFARFGIFTMDLADTVMLGRYSAKALAFYGLGNAPTFFAIIIMLGLSAGIVPVCSQLYGAEDYKSCGALWRKSLPYSVMIGIFGTLFCAFSEPILLFTGQTAEMAKGGGEAAFIRSMGFAFLMIYTVSESFLEGIKKTVPCMVIVILCNASNVLFNWIFIYGHLGFNEMGANGAALSTSLNRALMAVLSVIYIMIMRDKNFFGVNEKKSVAHVWDKTLKIGYGSCCSMTLEESAFFLMTIFAGWLGALSVAGFSIAINIISLVFMISLGFATAGSIKVGIAHGQKNSSDVMISGWLALMLNIFVMIFVCVLITVFSDFIASLYTNDSELLKLAGPLIAVAGLVVITDGSQGVMINILRGVGDVFVPSLIQGLCYLMILAPFSYALSFYFGMGAKGLFLGMIFATILSSMLLCLRFKTITKQ